MYLVFTRSFIVRNYSENIRYPFGSQKGACYTTHVATNERQARSIVFGNIQLLPQIIAYFAKISQSIAELVKKEIPFIWSVACN
jgi:hypothetical protein